MRRELRHILELALPVVAAELGWMLMGVVDTNVERVLARAFRIRGKKKSAHRTRRTWYLVNALVPRGRAGDWNQALMDLGATVCTARAPRCPACPVGPACRSRARYAPR